VTPEGRVKVKVKKVLEYYRSSIYVHMPVQNGMGKPSLDFVGCFWGFFFAVETKAPGKVPTERQEQTIADMRAAGAKVFVIAQKQADGSLLAPRVNVGLKGQVPPM